MNMRINGTELKSILDKATSNIGKVTYGHLDRIYFSVEDGKLKLTTFNMDNKAKMQLDTYTENVFFVNMTEYKPFSISVDDVKIIGKFKNEVIINVNDDSTITVKHGRKTITLACRMANKDVDIDPFDVNQVNNKNVLKINEIELVDTLTKLEIFANKKDANLMQTMYNINTNKRRIATLDGYGIGIKNLKEESIIEHDMEINLSIKCLKALKKLVNKKDLSRETIISYDGKYISLTGNDYNYIVSVVGGNYFDIDKVIDTDYEYTATLKDPKQWLEIFKYDKELKKLGTDVDDNKKPIKKPIILYKTENDLYCYFENNKYKALDILEIESDNIKNDFTIGFDPERIENALDILDGKIEVNFVNPKAPTFINGNDFKVVVLPVNIGIGGGIESLQNRIKDSIEKSKNVA